MDCVHVLSPPECPNRRPLKRRPHESIDIAGPPAEALSEPGALRPTSRVLPSVCESKPLLDDLRSVRANSENVSQKHTGHEPFDAQLPPAPVSVSKKEKDVTIAEALPPDGGWGWVVVFASFMVNFISDGMNLSFAVFFRRYLDHFGEDKFNAGWIIAILIAMPLLSGPIACFFTNRYGCRRVTIFGSILVAIELIVSPFVENVKILFSILGIMSRFGFNLCQVAAVVIVAYYFEKKRSLATGISDCGREIGILLTPLSRMLIDQYGLRGASFILAGLILIMAVCGLFFRDLPWMAIMNEKRAKERKKRRKRKRNKRLGSSADNGCFSDSKSEAAGSAKVPETVNIKTVKWPIVPQFTSLVDLPAYMTGGEGISLEVFEMMSNKRREYAIFAQKYPGVMLPSRSLSDGGQPPRTVMSPETSSPGTLLPNLTTQITQDQNSSVPLTDKTEKTPAFLNDLRVHRHSPTYRGVMLNINRYELRASSCPNIFRNSTTTIAKDKVQWYEGLWDFWHSAMDVLDFSHFKNPAFRVFALSNFLLYMWCGVPLMIIAGSTISKGFDKALVLELIVIVAISSLFGRIFIGWVGDRKCVSISVVYAICMLLCGGAIITIELAGYFFSLAAAYSVLAVCITANFSLTSTILVQQVTLEKFTNAYGWLLLIRGVPELIGGPLAGWISEMMDSYQVVYYVAGAFIGLSGLVLLVAPLSRCQVTQADPESLSLES